MILVTGATGMVGSHLIKALLAEGFEVIGVDRRLSNYHNENYKEVQVDLADAEQVKRIYGEYSISHTIHLAALAHTDGVSDISDEAYRQANVINARNVFNAAEDSKILFISTVDVFGFTKGIVNASTKPHPVTIYGKTKAEAETILKNSGCKYDIYRFSPVYTNEIKRDIQKRYYLKYPDWAYIIGAGSFYEVLSIENAVSAMVDWVKRDTCMQKVNIIKDPELLDTKRILKKEREEGRAKHIIYFPRWLISIGYKVLLITGENKYTYLFNKAVNPLRSE